MKKFSFLTFLLSLFFTSFVQAQDGTEAYKPIIGPTATARPIISGLVDINLTTFSPLTNITDGNKDNYATNTGLLGALSADGISVLSTTTFPAGYRAGFVVEITGGLLNANVLDAIQLQTLNNGLVVSTKTQATGLGVTLLGGATNSGKLYLNFASSGAFNEVRFSFINVVSLSLASSSVNIYYAMAFSPTGGLNEINNICDDQIAGVGTIVNFNAGLLGVLTGLTSRDNIIDGNKGNAGHLTLPAQTSLLSQDVYVGVTDLVNVYPSGNKAGFVIKATSSLLNATVLNNIKIQTYLFGDYVGEASFTNGSGLLKLSALSSSVDDKKRIEFVSPGKFNEVRLVIGTAVDLSVTSTDIYYAYESGSSCGDCSFESLLLSGSTSPYNGSIVTGNDFPGCTPVVIVVPVFSCNWTGPFGTLSLANSVTDQDNLVDADTANYALVNVNLGVLGGGARITVKNGGAATFAANSFAGFEIRKDGGLLGGLVDLSLLGGITVRAYNGTTEVGSSTGTALLNAGILAGTGGRTVVGFRPAAAFDRISFEGNSLLIGISTSFRVYKAFVIKDSDNDGTPDCTDLCAGNDALDVDGDGNPDACDLCDNSTVSPALSLSSLSNVCPLTTVSLSSITASNTPGGATLTWHTGTPATDGNKIATPTSVGTGIYFAAFRFGSDCYSGSGNATSAVTVYVSTCTTINPDFNVTLKNVLVNGNLNTNDIVPVGTTYGAPVANGGNPGGGVLNMNSDGTYDFTGANAGVYTYNVPVCVPGGSLPCPTTPLKITVRDPLSKTGGPIANPDITTTKVGMPVTVKTLANDASSDPTYSINPASVTVPLPNTPGGPQHGTTSVNAAGDITYTPNPGYIGTDTLTYTVCDNQPVPVCATALQVFQVYPAAAPNSTVVNDDYKSTGTGATLRGNVKTNDSDPEGNTQSVTPSVTPVSGKGTLTLLADGSYTFVPVPGFTGPVSFTYTSCDDGVPSACGSATLHILVTNLSPIAGVDNTGTPQNVAVTANLSINDVDPQGLALTYNTTPVQAPSNGGVVISSNGLFTYTPNLNFNGLDSFSYNVCNSFLCSVQKAFITVSSTLLGNDRPIAANDYPGTNVNTAVSSTVSGNDIDPDGDPLTFSLIGSTPNGSILMNPNGTYTYTPNNGFVGVDSVAYQACDNASVALCSTAKIYITVDANENGAENDAPVAVNDIARTGQGHEVTGNVGSNDTDPNGDILTFTAIGALPDGVVFNPNGSFSYTPAPDFKGSVTVPYQVCDNGTPSLCDFATLTLISGAGTPNLTPVISFKPSTIIGTKTVAVIVDIYEFNDVATSGTVTVYIPKDTRYVLNFNSSATVISGSAVSNSVWNFNTSSNPSFYILTTNAVVPASGVLSFGFTTLVNPNFSVGRVSITAILLDESGSESEIDNLDNTDDDVLSYRY